MPFDGKTYEPGQDRERLSGQLEQVRDLMKDGQWRTLAAIAAKCPPATEASVSARLRDLRKPKFGAFTVNRRGVKGAARGLYEYQVLPHQPQANERGQFGLNL